MGPAVTYSNTSTDFGPGAVLFLPDRQEAFFLPTKVPPGDPIDRVEIEVAAVADAMFGPLLLAGGCVDDISFVDNNVS